MKLTLPSVGTKWIFPRTEIIEIIKSIHDNYMYVKNKNIGFSDWPLNDTFRMMEQYDYKRLSK